MESDFDIAVIGAGVAGTYAAWRLKSLRNTRLEQQSDRPSSQRIGIFETSGRIGGRLFSERLPGIPESPVELGGMRFLNTHKRVNGLVKHFDLEFRPLPIVDISKKNLFYLRGRHFTEADWNRPDFTPPYLLDRSERARSAGSLLIETALKYQHSIDDIKNVGFWNLLLEEWSAEAYHLIREASGYDTIVNNWSAAEAIKFLLADFHENAQYFALSRGFQELPISLERQFGMMGGETFLSHRLHRIDRIDSQFVLTFDKNPDRSDSGRRVREQVTYTASKVILALPRRAIELIHPDSFIFDSKVFEQDLRTVIAQSGFKIFAAYRRPWWLKSHGLSEGRSITDLPIRQCYYWSTRKDKNSILMASYNDGASVEYWAGLAKQSEPYCPPLSACPPGIPIPNSLGKIHASKSLVQELQNQLRELHGLNKIDSESSGGLVAPYSVVCQDWSADPFGGGWHFWKIGENSFQTAERIRKPFSDVPLYVCGEAWCDQQGWVEGAIETVDKLLEKEFNLGQTKTAATVS